MLVIIKIFFLAVPACVLPTFSRISFKKLGLVAVGALLQVRVDKCGAEITFSKKIFVDWWNFEDRIGTIHAFIMTLPAAVASISNDQWRQVLICCSIETTNTFTIFSYIINQHFRITLCAIESYFLYFLFFQNKLLQCIENWNFKPATSNNCLEWGCILIEEDQCWILFNPKFLYYVLNFRFIWIFNLTYFWNILIDLKV